jgi:hypothetical protein
MNQVLRKFIHRAPRYILRPSDSQILNFSKQSETGSKHTTKIINISTTGIAFVVSRWQAPRIGDLIKIEFPIPAGDQVAWWAKVVRIESYTDQRWWDSSDSFDSPEEVVIAVTYIDLPEGHRKEIQKGLDERYQQLKKEYYASWVRGFTDFAFRNFWNFVLFGLCIVASVFALMLFTKYEPLFDRKNGSVYYKFFDKWDF